MYHLVYLTTNIINNKIYVGVHSTFKENDGYLGTGLGIKYAIQKYGKENFKRQILFYCLTDIDAYNIEKQIVNVYFIKRKDVYNNITGGQLSSIGRKVSNETRLKLSKPKSESTKLKLSLATKNRTPEHLHSMRTANIGRKFSQDSINKRLLKIIGSKEVTKLKPKCQK